MLVDVKAMKDTLGGILNNENGIDEAIKEITDIEKEKSDIRTLFKTFLINILIQKQENNRTPYRYERIGGYRG